ncbi:MAG: ATP-dependent Clp protease adapter ClpS [Mariprofundaceae bacterium]|nr:ATP-dependent Clp protease adapter ClpS [Mariprofundaceae bacterium]
MDTDTIITPHIQTEKPILKKPPMYKVIMFNDDYTPMDFVVELLKTYFKHTENSATTIMMHIHEQGLAICGVYPKDIAESKVAQVQAHCCKDEYPLRCSFEPQTDD